MVLYKVVDGVAHCQAAGPQHPSHSLTLYGRGCLCRHPTGGGEMWGHQGLDSAHQVCSAEVFYLTENRGLCWAVW